MSNTLYLVVVWGDVEPEVIGPFIDENQRDIRAGEIRAENGDKNGVYRLDISEEGKPVMCAFGGKEMDELIDQYYIAH